MKNFKVTSIENEGPTGRERLIAFAPFVLWIVVILVLGSSQGSSAQTSRFIRPIIEFFFPDAAPDTFLLIHSFIRKTAHFVEYGILAFLASRAFLSSLPALSPARLGALSLASVAVVACLDEISQSYLSTRTGSARDVLIDVCGGALGAGLYYLLVHRRRPLAVR